MPKPHDHRDESDLTELSEKDLEGILVERWAYRGSLLALAIVLATVGTIFITRSSGEVFDFILVGSIAAFLILTFLVIEILRRRDRQVHRELQRRRRQ